MRRNKTDKMILVPYGIYSNDVLNVFISFPAIALGLTQCLEKRAYYWKVTCLNHWKIWAVKVRTSLGNCFKCSSESNQGKTTFHYFSKF